MVSRAEFRAAARKHPFVAVLNALVLAFAVLELAELLFGFGLHWLLPEEIVEAVLLVLQSLAIWHAVRHL
ncbi:MAG TPA: hypothetical protein VJR47_02665 [Stellaceae bacterium]|nr:hypothetical protein [Stellaceae bacterium]